MLENQVFLGHGFGSSAAVLHPFFNEYGLLESENSKASEFFMEAIKQRARTITKEVKKAGGFDGRPVRVGSNDMIRNATYRRGYEHIRKVDWNGVMDKRFMEVSEARRQLAFGFDAHTYTKEEVVELCEIVKHFAMLYQQDELALTSDCVPILASESTLSVLSRPRSLTASPSENGRESGDKSSSHSSRSSQSLSHVSICERRKLSTGGAGVRVDTVCPFHRPWPC